MTTIFWFFSLVFVNSQSCRAVGPCRLILLNLIVLTILLHCHHDPDLSSRSRFIITRKGKKTWAENLKRHIKKINSLKIIGWSAISVIHCLSVSFWQKIWLCEGLWWRDNHWQLLSDYVEAWLFSMKSSYFTGKQGIWLLWSTVKTCSNGHATIGNMFLWAWGQYHKTSKT